MRKTVVILNPAARSEKAGNLTSLIEETVGNSALIRTTSAAGDARKIAEWAVKEGFEQVIAAGGDGTINEVVNGIAQTDVVLGLLPVGTMNVFAAELGLPKTIEECWDVIEAGNVCEIDLPMANDHAFVQMGGVGLDAQVVKETSWEFKRNFGPLSYLICATQVAARKPPRLVVEAGGMQREGSFVLVGNGRYYGGPFPVFPNAKIDDGLLDVLVFKNQGHIDIVRYMHGVIFGTHPELDDVDYFLAPAVRVTGDDEVPAEVDGELIGNVPIDFHFSERKLRVLSPGRRLKYSPYATSSLNR